MLNTSCFDRRLIDNVFGVMFDKTHVNNRYQLSFVFNFERKWNLDVDIQTIIFQLISLKGIIIFYLLVCLFVFFFMYFVLCFVLLLLFFILLYLHFCLRMTLQSYMNKTLKIQIKPL